jgi:hypothetical protein
MCLALHARLSTHAQRRLWFMEEDGVACRLLGATLAICSFKTYVLDKFLRDRARPLIPPR